MEDTPGTGPPPPKGLQQLTDLAASFMELERDVRVAVLDAVDAEFSLKQVSEATHLSMPLLQYWTGAEPDYDSRELPPRVDPGVLDQIGEQRQLHTGTPAERVAAKTAKQQRDQSTPP